MATTDLSPFNALIAQAIAAHTHILLEQLIVLDNSAKYCAEGINPNASIKQSLSAIFDTMATLNRMADFPRPTRATRVLEECVTVVSNLGFQEGNDLPSRTGPILKRLTRPGDLLLSEMQVFYGSTVERVRTREVEAAAIEQSDLLPEMRHFSLLVGQRFGSGNLQEPNAAPNGEQQEDLFKIMPLQTKINSVNVAATLVSVRIDGVKKYVLTNNYLKDTRDQFKQAREASSDFVVIASQETGDKSIIFQVTERRQGGIFRLLFTYSESYLRTVRNRIL